MRFVFVVVVVVVVFAAAVVNQDCVVGMASRYGLDGPGIESRWGRDFPHPSRLAQEPTQTSMKWVANLFIRG